MDPVFVLTDDGRKIKFKEMIHFYDVILGDNPFHLEGKHFEKICCGIVDYKDPEDVVSAANAIRVLVLLDEVMLAGHDNSSPFFKPAQLCIC